MTNPVGALFGRSPIKPIERHMAKAQSCVPLLGQFLEAVFAEDWKKARALRRRIIKAGEKSREIKQDIRCRLPRSLLLPVARADLLELLKMQDRLANCSQDITGLMLVRKMTVPADLVEPLRAYFQSVQETSQQALTAVNRLDELLETGFSGREAVFLENLVSELHDMERRGEAARFGLYELLYVHERSIPPVDAMFMYKLVESIGDIAVISHRIGGRLLQLVAS